MLFRLSIDLLLFLRVLEADISEIRNFFRGVFGAGTARLFRERSSVNPT
jgi:hypothetical protein